MRFYIIYGHQRGARLPRFYFAKLAMRRKVRNAIWWASVRFAWLLLRASGFGPVSLEGVERALRERD
jgi:hypothetical protein